MTISSILLIAHIAAGTIAVMLTVPPLIAPKGGGLHRKGGRAYVAAMWFVLGTAVMLSLLALRPYFVALTAAAAIGCFSGVRVLRRKRPDLDPGQRATALDWLATLLFLGIGLALLLAIDPRTLSGNATVFRALTWATIVYALYDLCRFAFPTAFPFFPRLWFYEHLIKMIGSCSAVVAAFSGSVLTFLPIAEPWKQLWPTILFHNLIVVMVIRYALRDRRRRQAGSPASAS